jgi:hypothetical protein
MTGVAAELRRPVRVDFPRGRIHVVHVATLADEMQAAPDRIYRVLKGVAEGHGGTFEWAEVIGRDNNLLVCKFWTEMRLPRGLRFRFPTRESVELDPPLAVHYRHRSGPSRGIAETITIDPIDGTRSRVTYRAIYPSASRAWAWTFALVAKPVAHVFMRIHFDELRRSVERAA